MQQGQSRQPNHQQQFQNLNASVQNRIKPPREHSSTFKANAQQESNKIAQKQSQQMVGQALYNLQNNQKDQRSNNHQQFSQQQAQPMYNQPQASFFPGMTASQKLQSIQQNQSVQNNYFAQTQSNPQNNMMNININKSLQGNPQQQQQQQQINMGQQQQYNQQPQYTSAIYQFDKNNSGQNNSNYTNYPPQNNPYNNMSSANNNNNQQGYSQQQQQTYMGQSQQQKQQLQAQAQQNLDQSQRTFNQNNQIPQNFNQIVPQGQSQNQQQNNTNQGSNYNGNNITQSQNNYPKQSYNQQILEQQYFDQNQQGLNINNTLPNNYNQNPPPIFPQHQEFSFVNKGSSNKGNDISQSLQNYQNQNQNPDQQQFRNLSQYNQVKAQQLQLLKSNSDISASASFPDQTPNISSPSEQKILEDQSKHALGQNNSISPTKLGRTVSEQVNSNEKNNQNLYEVPQSVTSSSINKKQGVSEFEDYNKYSCYGLLPYQNLEKIKNDDRMIEALASQILNKDVLDNINELRQELTQKVIGEIFSFEKIITTFNIIAKEFTHKLQQQFSFELSEEKKILFDGKKILGQYKMQSHVEPGFLEQFSNIHELIVSDLFSSTKVLEGKFDETILKQMFLAYLKYGWMDDVFTSITFNSSIIANHTNLKELKNANFQKDLTSKTWKKLSSQIQEIVEKIQQVMVEELFQNYQRSSGKNEKSFTEIQKQFEDSKKELIDMIDKFFQLSNKQIVYEDSKNALACVILYKKIQILSEKLNLSLQNCQSSLNDAINNTLLDSRKPIQLEKNQIERDVHNSYLKYIVKNTTSVMKEILQYASDYSALIDYVICGIDQAKINQFQDTSPEYLFIKILVSPETYQKNQELAIDEEFLKRLIEMSENTRLFLIFKNKLISFITSQDFNQVDQTKSAIFYLNRALSQILEQFSYTFKENTIQKRNEEQLFAYYKSSLIEIPFFHLKLQNIIQLDKREYSVYVRISGSSARVVSFTIILKNVNKPYSMSMNESIAEYRKNFETSADHIEQIKLFETERIQLSFLFLDFNKSHRSGLIAMYLYYKQNLLKEPPLVSGSKGMIVLKKIFGSSSNTSTLRSTPLSFEQFQKNCEDMYYYCKQLKEIMKRNKHESKYFRVFPEKNQQKQVDISNYLDGTIKYELGDNLYIFMDIDQGSLKLIQYKKEHKQDYKFIISFDEQKETDKDHSKLSDYLYQEIKFSSFFERQIFFTEFLSQINQNQQNLHFFFRSLFIVISSAIYQNKSIVTQFGRDYFELLRQQLENNDSPKIKDSPVNTNQNIGFEDDEDVAIECTISKQQNQQSLETKYSKQAQSRQDKCVLTKFMQHGEKLTVPGMDQQYHNEYLKNNKSNDSLKLNESLPKELDIYEQQRQTKFCTQNLFCLINPDSFEQVVKRFKNGNTTLELNHLVELGFFDEVAYNPLKLQNEKKIMVLRNNNQYLPPYVISLQQQVFQFHFRKVDTLSGINSFNIEAQSFNKSSLFSETSVLNQLECLLWLQYQQFCNRKIPSTYQSNLDQNVFNTHLLYIWIYAQFKQQQQSISIKKFLNGYSDYQLDNFKINIIKRSSIYTYYSQSLSESPSFKDTYLFMRYTQRYQLESLIIQTNFSKTQKEKLFKKYNCEILQFDCKSLEIFEFVCKVFLPYYLETNQELENNKFSKVVSNYLALLKEDFCNILLLLPAKPQK